ncbi:hypothetical protein [Streptomyces collinus]|uniref:hypothetical protein n=1 Tax=Streptomyces collinus TaxID=42684 RepID=UPI003698AC85
MSHPRYQNSVRQGVAKCILKLVAHKKSRVDSHFHTKECAVRKLRKKFAGGAAVFGVLAMTVTAGVQPAAASSSCQLSMIHNQYWEAHVICASSRAGAIVDRIEYIGDDGWLGESQVAAFVPRRETPANNHEIVIIADTSPYFNEDYGLPYEDDEIYAKVYLRDPVANVSWIVKTNEVSGDFS